MGKYKKGHIVNGIVSGVTNYGIFVKVDENYDGLIHISEISSKFVSNPNNFAKINDSIQAIILDVDDEKEQIKLSIKNLKSKKKSGSEVKIQIKETEHGFSTLAKRLPIWIEEGLNCKKNNNYIDK